MTLRLVMMGTGDFALPVFRGLCESSHTILALVTKPQSTGSGHHRHYVNHMKETALERGIPVLQPPNVNALSAVEELQALNPDVFVVADYGQLLSAHTLSVPRLAAINVHASLLPKYRGASPVAHAILHGEPETGVSILAMEARLDAGPVIASASTPIAPQETAGELEARLARLAVPLTMTVLDQLEAGTAQRRPQDAFQATRAPRLKKSDGAVDWQMSAGEIDRHVRAMQPWPVAYTFLHTAEGKPLRLNVLRVIQAEGDCNGPPGTVAHVTKSQLIVNSGDRPLEIEQLQPEGRRRMTAAEFLRGRAISAGDRLSAESGNHFTTFQ